MGCATSSEGCTGFDPKRNDTELSNFFEKVKNNYIYSLLKDFA